MAGKGTIVLLLFCGLPPSERPNSLAQRAGAEPMKALIITWISLIIISITYLKTANRTIRSIERENEHESLSKVEEESEKAVYKD